MTVESQLNFGGLDFSASLLNNNFVSNGETSVDSDCQGSTNILSHHNISLTQAPSKEKNNNSNISDFIVSTKYFRSSNGRKIIIKPKLIETSFNTGLTETCVSDQHHSSIAPHGDNSLGLINMDTLFRKLDVEKRLEKQMAESNAAIVKPLVNVFKNNNQNPSKTKKTKSQNNRKNHTLWTEKWRPNNFLELVGNERTNRSVLQWLCHWSKAVFGKEIDKDIIKLRENHYNNHTPIIDPFDRPGNKILLIHGPPGIGKTSIAHAIANQLKYEILEINASDERSANYSLKNKIQTSLNSITISGKPICLICDEIDGGNENGIIKILLDLINDDKRATLNHSISSSEKKGKSDKKNSSKFLMRPIIAICNDIYSHSLDKLKPYCEIINFKGPPERFIKDRLKQICKIEKLNINDKLIDALIETTNYDLRNCLNFLQFSQSSILSLGDNDNNNNNNSNGFESLMSSKDTQLNWYLIVDSIFNRNVKLNKMDNFNKLYDILKNTSQTDKIVNGCFNNFLTKQNDSFNFEKPLEANDWLHFYDLINNGSNFYEIGAELQGYSNLIPLKFFQLYGELNNYTSNKGNNMASSYKSREFFEKKKFVNETIRRFKHKILNSMNFKNDLYILDDENEQDSKDHNNYRDINITNLNTIEIPLFEKIAIPELTSKNYHNLKTFEKSKINNSINLIKNYDFKFEFSKSEFNNRIINLNPDIIKLTAIDISDSHDKNNVNSNINNKALSHSLNIIYEIYRENKRKREELRENSTSESSWKKRKLELESKSSSSNSETPNQPANKKFTSSVDYFKSKYSEFNHQTGSNDKTDKDVKTISDKNGVMSLNENRIWVKYHEGFSNAVRKNITWNDLFS
ncbi:hypothetical protein BVG19_g5503 [[Candida] boidinii]|nr:hypothetical protein BVG19_g5503 [[Candida] boidinii]OWB53288.1 hypothetical protein B5S27_g4881 [[Candida] boidinii]